MIWQRAETLFCRKPHYRQQVDHEEPAPTAIAIVNPQHPRYYTGSSPALPRGATFRSMLSADSQRADGC